jgi:hypothetical protein
MARNKLAGTKRGKSKSAAYFQDNPEARKKKNAYNKKYHKSETRKKYRAKLNKANREADTYGNGDGKDMSHDTQGKLRKERQSTNRARNGRGGTAKKRKSTTRKRNTTKK